MIERIVMNFNNLIENIASYKLTTLLYCIEVFHSIVYTKQKQKESTNFPRHGHIHVYDMTG